MKNCLGCLWQICLHLSLIHIFLFIRHRKTTAADSEAGTAAEDGEAKEAGEAAESAEEKK